MPLLCQTANFSKVNLIANFNFNLTLIHCSN